ncbi:MAG: SdrD B-like domain-containing protein [Clostridia bacterium]|nr:SdrD B-like domain-containing protein [Clostridia bacterium]
MKRYVLVLVTLLLAVLCCTALADDNTAQLTYTVFGDGNGNGDFGRWEKGYAGATLTLLQAEDDAPVAEAVSDEEGRVVFSGLSSGKYKLKVTLPEGYAFGPRGKEGKSTSSIMGYSENPVQVSDAIKLENGQKKSGCIGINRMSSLSGIIWLDESNEGILQDGEPGVGGVRVVLIGEKNGMSYETISADDGSYAFRQVKPGEYRLRVYLPDGYGFTRYSSTGRENRSVITTEGKGSGSKVYELSAGENIERCYVGLVECAVIRGTCFLDANYNGLYDAGESGLAGVKLEITREGADNALNTVKTAEDGGFVFSGLRDGTFTVRVVLPDNGACFTRTAQGGNSFIARPGRREYSLEYTVAIGETVELPVGAYMPGYIKGRAYMDNNFSGTKDKKENGTSGIEVKVFREDGTYVLSARTNNKGGYTTEGLAPGRYYVTAEAKRGYAFTKLAPDNVMINLGGGKGRSEVFDVPMGETVSDISMGMIKPGVVDGMVFADRNDNGLQDKDEKGLAGTVVRLMSDEGEHFSATVGEDGAFKFDSVMPGRYYLEYTMPEHGVAAICEAGGNTLTGGENVARSDWFDFKTGSTYHAPLAGGLLLGTISGNTFADHDGSGEFDAGNEGKQEEDLLPGVTLTLTPSRADIDEATVVTGEDGSFFFGALRPDTYTLTLTWPDGMVTTRPNGTTLDFHAGRGTESITVPLTMGDSWTDQLLGGAVPTTIRGICWLDENNNGRYDAGEATVKGQQIEIIDESERGVPHAPMIVDENGFFSADDIVPGSYTLRAPFRTAMKPARDGECTFREENGAMVMHGVTAVEGSAVEGLKLGFIHLQTISGKVWVDRNGSVDGLPGAVVTLTDEYGAVLSTVKTGENGRYAFNGLMPGAYAVSVTTPTGSLVVEPEDIRLTGAGLVSVMTMVEGNSGSGDIIDVTMTGSYSGNDIGTVLPGTIGDLCWLDENGNGLQDTGELGLKNVTVQLLRDGKPVAETVTDAYGRWAIDNVYPAVYTLKVTAPDEVVPTRQNTAFSNVISVLKEGGEGPFISREVTVASNQCNYDADCGFVLKKNGAYPEGYGVYPKQDWTPVGNTAE